MLHNIVLTRSKLAGFNKSISNESEVQSNKVVSVAEETFRIHHGKKSFRLIRVLILKTTFNGEAENMLLILISHNNNFILFVFVSSFL